MRRLFWLLLAALSTQDAHVAVWLGAVETAG